MLLALVISSIMLNPMITTITFSAPNPGKSFWLFSLCWHLDISRYGRLLFGSRAVTTRTSSLPASSQVSLADSRRLLATCKATTAMQCQCNTNAMQCLANASTNVDTIWPLWSYSEQIRSKVEQVNELTMKASIFWIFSENMISWYDEAVWYISISLP